VKNLCEPHLPGRQEIGVVDLAEHASLAQEDDIVALPALLRRRPESLGEIIGDRSNTERLVVCLRLGAPR
jgi:circadian clock protein KaiB